MAGEKTLLYRILGLGERKLTDLTNELLGNPKFANALGKAIQKTMETKGRFDKNVHLVFSAVNMPTKADYDRLAEKVGALNKNLNEIDLRIDGLIKKMESRRPSRPAGKTAKKAAKKTVKKTVKKAAKKTAKKTAKKAAKKTKK